MAPLSAATILAEVPIPPICQRTGFHIASTSSSSNDDYSDFNPDTFSPFEDDLFSTFRGYIARMGYHVDFSGNVIGAPAPYPPPMLHGYSMRSESDVRAFLCSLIIDPIRPIVLEMLPHIATRDYDLQFVRKMRPPILTPVAEQYAVDLAVCKVREHHRMLPLVLVEFKAPNVVYGARNSARVGGDPNEDWIRFTKQLRKYATVTRCRHLVVLDQKCAFYFHLTGAFIEDGNAPIFVMSAETPDQPPNLAPTAASSSSGAQLNSCVTMRELLCFAIWNALRLGALQGDPHKPYAPGTVDTIPARCSYQALPQREPAPVAPRRSTRSTRQRDPLLSEEHRTLTLRRVDRIAVRLRDKEHPSIWHLHNSLNHDGDDDVPRDEAGYHSDPGFGDSLDPSPTTNCRELHIFPSALSTISSQDRLWLRDVSVVKSGVYTATVNIDPATTPSREGSVYVKQFLGEDRFKLANELRAYAALTSLQAVGVPLCIGVFAVAEEPPPRSPAPDNAAVSLSPEEGSRNTPPESSPPSPVSPTNEGNLNVDNRTLYLVLTSLSPNAIPLLDAREVFHPDEIHALTGEAMELLGKIHAAGVLHNDLSSRNVIVTPGELQRVGVVDFEAAKVDPLHQDGDRRGETEMRLMRSMFAAQE